MRLLFVLCCVSSASCMFGMDLELKAVQHEQSKKLGGLLQGDELDEYFNTWKLEKNSSEPERLVIEGIEPLPLCSAVQGNAEDLDKSRSFAQKTRSARSEIFERRLKIFNVLRERQLLAYRAASLEKKLQDACHVVNKQEEELERKKMALSRCEMIYNDMKSTIERAEDVKGQLDSENKLLRSDNTLKQQQLELLLSQKEKNCCNVCPIL